jgi:hypothetical protein
MAISYKKYKMTTNQMNMYLYLAFGVDKKDPRVKKLRKMVRILERQWWKELVRGGK